MGGTKIRRRSTEKAQVRRGRTPEGREVRLQPRDFCGERSERGGPAAAASPGKSGASLRTTGGSTAKGRAPTSRWGAVPTFTTRGDDARPEVSSVIPTHEHPKFEKRGRG